MLVLASLTVFPNRSPPPIAGPCSPSTSDWLGISYGSVQGFEVRVADVAARTLYGYEAAQLGASACGLRALAGRLKCARCGAKDARLAVLPPV